MLPIGLLKRTTCRAAQKDLRGEAREKSTLRLRSGQARRRRNTLSEMVRLGLFFYFDPTT
jgi:hypothetical protein